MTQLLLSLLGPFQAKIDGQPVTDFPTDKIRALLAYLAVEADKPHRRAALATLLWPDYTDAIALRNLRQSLHRLRQTLDPIAPTLSDRLFTVTRQTLALNSSALTLDVAQIEQALKAVTAHPHAALPECTSCLTLLRTAVGTYQGEFLQGFLVEATPAFEEWQTIRREQLHHQIIEALRHLTLAHEQLRDHQAMYDAAGHLLRLEPWREEAHQWAMRALVLGGQRSEALAQYERCRAVLAAELGVEPSEITTALYQQIQRGQLAPVLAEKSAISMLPPHDAGGGTPLFGFPHGQTKFLGRSAELAQLTGYLVAADYPLVTLVGPGGSGKTRLAIEVAKQHLRQTACFGDGIFFVPLASVVDPSLLPAAIAAAVGLHLHDQSGHRQQLLDFLRNKVLLLVLDNFEQLVAGTTLLVEISAVSPTVKLLVTSRVALNLQREQRLVVGGLGYPTTGAEPPLLASDAHRDAALTHSAVQLFLQSARQVQPDFVVDGETWGAIVQICALVQGMPLALELAATWVRLADCATIVNEISSNLDFLSITAPDPPATAACALSLPIHGNLLRWPNGACWHNCRSLSVALRWRPCWQ
ncbi:MAG: BTAD domain-containing putative transcriptional regulator [Caldilineaceae bacterium]